MRSFLITGDIDSRNSFVKKICEGEGISSYNVIHFEEEVTIEKAKELKKILAQTYSSKTLVILSAINLNAQNALLKTLEDVQENVSIIISAESSEGIIDTVKSRLFFVNTGREKDPKISLVDIGKFENQNIGEVLKEADIFLQENSELPSPEVFARFIVNYREALLQQEKSFSSIHIAIMKNLLSNYKLVKNNNVNLRFALESSLLQK